MKDLLLHVISYHVLTCSVLYYCIDTDGSGLALYLLSTFALHFTFFHPYDTPFVCYIPFNSMFVELTAPLVWQVLPN